MNLADELASGLVEVGMALRRPEDLARRWRDRLTSAAPSPAIFPLLLANAVLGVAAYGLFMRLHLGAAGMLEGALRAPLATGTAWLLALPALYIVNRALGSQLDFSTTLLAAAIVCSFGALAMLASIPITWFFTLALPYKAMRLLVNATVFTGVGICMVDVFVRVMRSLEPERGAGYPYVWMALLSVIGLELFTLLDLFQF